MLHAFCDASAQYFSGVRHFVSAWILKDCTEGIVVSSGVINHERALGMTVNAAEYYGVWGVLDYLLVSKITDKIVTIHTDSKIVVNHINGTWQCNSANLVAIKVKIEGLLGYFVQRPTFTWIPREQNHEADKLSRTLYPVKMSRKKKHKLLKAANGI